MPKVSANLLIQKFSTVLDKVGEVRMNEMLDNALIQGKDKIFIDYIIHETGRTLNANIIKLKNPHKYRLDGNEHDAMCCICYIVKKHLEYTYRSINEKICRKSGKHMAFYYVKQIQELSDAIPQHRKLKKIINEISEKTEVFIRESKEKCDSIN